MAVYLVDTENTHNAWTDVMYFAKPDDRVFLFYSKHSPAIHMENIDFLSSSKTKVEYIHVGCSGDNALDFQLVSFLGYIIANNIAVGKLEPYFIVSCDGGFDATVGFWRERNILCQRLVSDMYVNQILPAGPMVSVLNPRRSAPSAIKPCFSRIRKYAQAFREGLVDTEYFEFRYEIAELFQQTLDLRLPNDKFVLAFRNALASHYGAQNSVYRLLKPVIAKLRESEMAKPTVNADEPIALVAPAPELVAKPAVPAKPAPAPAPASSDADKKPVKKEPKPLVPSVRITNEAKFAQILKLPQLVNLETAIRKELPSDLKLQASVIVQLMALTVNTSTAIWNKDYRAALVSQFEIKRMPKFVLEVPLTYFAKTTRSELMKILA